MMDAKGGIGMEILINKADQLPIYIQIYQQLKRQILSGQLSEGTVLLPERKLAVELGVNRTTILNAYNKLKLDNLITSKVGQGTVVCAKIEKKVEIFEPQWSQLFNSRLQEFNNDVVAKMFSHMGDKQMISFALGMAEPSLMPKLPFDELDKYYNKNNNLLSQTPIAGDIELRETICDLLSKENTNVTAEQVMILTGSQQGIDIAARLFLESGDIVFAEAPTYFLALQSFKGVGAKIIEVPTDHNGMKMETLEQLIKRYHPKCIYTVPNYQNPSSCCMSLDRRKRLVELSWQYGVMILEDDAYAYLGFYEKDLPSLFQLDTRGYVVCFRTFSKTICSGIRLGYMLAHKNIIVQASMVRQCMDIHPNSISQWLVSAYIRSGQYEQHIECIRSDYKIKSEWMHKVLLQNAPDTMTWTKPIGGFYFWCQIPKEVKASELLIECIKQGVVFMPGIPFFVFQNGENFIRLNFTTPSKKQIQIGISILCNTIKQLINKNENSIHTTSCMPIY